MSDKPGEMEMCEGCEGPRSISTAGPCCVICFRGSSNCFGIDAPTPKLDGARRKRIAEWVNDCSEDDHLDPEKVREAIIQYEALCSGLHTKLEDMTRRAITACLSTGLRAQDVHAIETQFLMCREGEEAERFKRLEEIWDDHKRWADTKCLSIGESFAVVLHKDTPKGKVYLVPESALEEFSDREADWLKGFGVVENIGEWLGGLA